MQLCHPNLKRQRKPHPTSCYQSIWPPSLPPTPGQDHQTRQVRDLLPSIEEGIVQQSTQNQRGNEIKEKAQHTHSTRLGGNLLSIHSCGCPPEAAASFRTGGLHLNHHKLGKRREGPGLVQVQPTIQIGSSSKPDLQWHKWEPDIWLTVFMGAAAPPSQATPCSRSNRQHSNLHQSAASGIE